MIISTSTVLPTNKKIVRWCIFIIALINFNYSNSQTLPDSLKTYYNFSNKGELALFRRDYRLAILHYNSAFKSARPRCDDVINIIKAYHYLENYKKAEKWIRYGIMNFGIAVENYTFHDSIIPLFYLSRDNFILEYGIFNSSPDRVQVRSMINHYQYNDIFFRNQLERLNFQCLNSQNSYSLALKYDSAFAIPYIRSLIEKYHFPDAYDVGYFGKNSFHALIRHYNIEKSVFDSALVNGKILPEEYASIIDYHFNWDFEAIFKADYKGGPLKPKQNFGLNMTKMEDGTFVVVLPDDYEHVDERRNSIGLPPLWQTALINGYKLPQEYIVWLKKNNIWFEK